jgi:hypothetical protein
LVEEDGFAKIATISIMNQEKNAIDVKLLRLQKKLQLNEIYFQKEKITSITNLIGSVNIVEIIIIHFEKFVTVVKRKNVYK